MKRFLSMLAWMILLVACLAAQTPQHAVALAWTDPSNPTGATYNVYRATGLCSGTPSYNKVATGVTGLAYTDTTVIPGPYCYYVTAVLNGVESVPSPTINPTVPAFAPATLAVTSVK